MGIILLSIWLYELACFRIVYTSTHGRRKPRSECNSTEPTCLTYSPAIVEAMLTYTPNGHHDDDYYYHYYCDHYFFYFS